MRKIAFSATTLIVAIVSGQVSRAQSREGPAPGVTSPAEARALLQQGIEREKGGEYEAAAKLYREYMAKAPNDPQYREAAFRAGKCLEARGNHNEAIAFYEKAVPGPLDYLRIASLYYSARCYSALGETSKALGALRLQRAESPIDEFSRKALLLQATLEGKTEEQARELVAAEERAAQLYRQGRDALRARSFAAAVEGCDQVLAKYPDTGAAFQALSCKAEALWHLRRYGEMCETYAKLRERMRKLPDSDRWHGMYQTMDYRVGWYRATSLAKELIGQCGRGKKVPDERWEQLRVWCGRWRGNATEPQDRAEAEVLEIESYAWQGRYEQAVRAAKEFLARSDDQQTAPELKRSIGWAQLYAAESLERLGRYDEAERHFRRVIDRYRDDAAAWRAETALPHAYYGLWLTLRKAGAPESTISEAANAILAGNPNSYQARQIREHNRSKVAKDKAAAQLPQEGSTSHAR